MAEATEDGGDAVELPGLLHSFLALMLAVLKQPREFVRTYILENPSPLRLSIKMFLFSSAMCVIIALPALLFAADEPKKGLVFLSSLLDAGTFAAVFYVLSAIVHFRRGNAHELLALYLLMTAVFNPLLELFYIPVYFLLPEAVAQSFCPSSASIVNAVDKLDSLRFIFLLFYTSVGNWVLLATMALWYVRTLTTLFENALIRVIAAAIVATGASSWLLIHVAYPFVCAHEGALNRIVDSLL